MSIALYTLIFLSIAFFVWRNFMKNKELTVGIAQRVCKKHSIDLLDETVCLRKMSIKFENSRPCFYRFYSFDYNVMESFERYRGFIVLRNGRLDDVIISDKDEISLQEQQPSNNGGGKVISFDD